MDRPGPPTNLTISLLGVLNRFRQQKRCYDVMMSRQEGSMTHHLVNAHCEVSPASV